MLLLFCSDPLTPTQPDDVYRVEADAAERLGFTYELIDFEALTHEHNPQRAVRRVRQREQEQVTALYRGWMLPVADYALLYAALADTGVQLVTTPEQYRYCHHLPEWYPLLAAHTPHSVWLPWSGAVDIEAVHRLLEPFGSRPLVLKDYVKSRKHEWDDACFIPAADDRTAVDRVVRRFVDGQGEDLAGGLVFREYVDLMPLGRHSRSGMPLTKEYRAFVFEGQVVATAPYWDEGAYDSAAPDTAMITALIAAVPSPFFTVDLAQQRTGEWILIELGDGQVAGLPERLDAGSFYQALAAHPSTVP